MEMKRMKKLRRRDSTRTNNRSFLMRLQSIETPASTPRTPSTTTLRRQMKRNQPIVRKRQLKLIATRIRRQSSDQPKNPPKRPNKMIKVAIKKKKRIQRRKLKKMLKVKMWKTKKNNKQIKLKTTLNQNLQKKVTTLTKKNKTSLKKHFKRFKIMEKTRPPSTRHKTI